MSAKPTQQPPAQAADSAQAESARFEVVDMPRGVYGKYAALIEALIALPEGKALRVPVDTFPRSTNASAETFLRMKRRYGRACHNRKLPDGIYIWLDPPNGNGGAK